MRSGRGERFVVVFSHKTLLQIYFLELDFLNLSNDVTVKTRFPRFPLCVPIDAEVNQLIFYIASLTSF